MHPLSGGVGGGLAFEPAGRTPMIPLFEAGLRRPLERSQAGAAGPSGHREHEGFVGELREQCPRPELQGVVEGRSGPGGVSRAEESESRLDAVLEPVQVDL